MLRWTEKNGPTVSRLQISFASTSADTSAPDVHDVQMVVVILWQPDDATHAGFLDWLRSDFMPGVLESPETLRSSIYKLQHDSPAENATVKAEDTGMMQPYMTMWEFDCDELPWDVLISLGSKEGWRHFVDGGQVQWQVGMYLVNRVYPDGDERLLG
jgi:hypothetical protein